MAILDMVGHAQKTHVLLTYVEKYLEDWTGRVTFAL